MQRLASYWLNLDMLKGVILSEAGLQAERRISLQGSNERSLARW